LAFVLLFSVAIGTIALLFPQRLAPMLANSPTLKDNLPPWMMSLVVQMAGKPTTTLPEAKPESKPAADVGPSVPPPAADSSANKSETGAAKVPAKADPVASTDTAPAKPADTAKPAEPAASVTSTTDTATTKVPVEDALAPRSERGVDQMIRQTAAGSVFVQHVSVNSMAEAQEWRAQYRALTGARIAAVTAQNKGVRYIVISGPFANMKEAETFARKDGVPADPWLRPVKSLQRGLQPARR
jgi:DamX protein